MKDLIRRFKIKVLQYLEQRLVKEVNKLNKKLEKLQTKIKLESARVQRRIK